MAEVVNVYLSNRPEKHRITISTLTQREQLSLYNTLWLYYQNLGEHAQKFINPDVVLWLDAVVNGTHKTSYDKIHSDMVLDLDAKLYSDEYIKTKINLELLINELTLIVVKYFSTHNTLWMDMKPIEDIHIDYLIHPNTLAMILDLKATLYKEGTEQLSNTLWLSSIIRESMYDILYPNEIDMMINLNNPTLTRARYRQLGDMDGFALGDYDDMPLSEIFLITD